MNFELQDGEEIVQTLSVDSECNITLTTMRIVKVLDDLSLVNSVDLVDLKRTTVGPPAIRKRGLVLSLLGITAGIWLYLILPQNWLGYTLSIIPIVASAIVLLDAFWLNRRKILMRFYGRRRKSLTGLVGLQYAEQVHSLLSFSEDLAQQRKLPSELSAATDNQVGDDI